MHLAAATQSEINLKMVQFGTAAPPASGFWGWATEQPVTPSPPSTRPAPFTTSQLGALEPRRMLTVCSPPDDLSVQFEGEVFNADTLCAELNLEPGTPLPALLLEGWRRWSFDFFTRLNGVFVLALRCAHGIHLYRDPSGLKNLYVYAGRPGPLAYASRLGLLWPLPGVERRISRRALHEYLRFLDIAAPTTLYERVKAIEPGECLSFADGALQSRVLLAPTSAEPGPPSFEAAVDRLDAELRKAADARLAHAARPAAFLSGGIDSALLCSLAAQQRADTLALTVGFAAPPFDESPMAAQIARHIGLQHQVLRFDRSDYLGALAQLGQSMDQPMADPAAPATLLAFTHCKGRFDAVLDGTGADEAVGVMPPRHVRVAVEYGSLIPRRLRLPLGRALAAFPPSAPYAQILRFEHPADTMIRWRGFSRVEIEALCDEPVAFEDTTFYRTFRRFDRGEHFERYSALLNAMPCERLNQCTAITGAPIRFPFCDPATDHFVRQLPVDFRHRHGEPKRLYRALLKRYVPASLWDQPKHGFDFPLHDFLKGDNYALVRQHLDRDRWHARSLLDADRVRDYAQRYIDGADDLYFRVWALVVLDAWLDAHSA